MAMIRTVQEVYDLTGNLVEGLRLVRSNFYKDCLELSDVAEFSNKTPRPQPALSVDGHFVVGSFELWAVFSLFIAKLTQYLDEALVQDFYTVMYGRVLGPYVHGELDESISEGAMRFNALAIEQAGEPYEEMYQRMREVIFTGKCNMCGDHRSDLSLGIIGINVVGLRGGLTVLTGALILRTWILTALEFGDQQLADEQAKALQAWANGPAGFMIHLSSADPE